MGSLAITEIGAELLDDPAADPATVAESLHHIARANRWFGGSAAVRYGLRCTLRAVPPGTALSLLDLGTGLGDLPAIAKRWGSEHRIRILPIGLELNRAAARLAQRAGLPVAVACAGAPPIGDKSVDVILVSQLAHHLTHESVVRLLQTCDRLARRAVIVADLRRHALAPASFWLGARLLRFDRVTMADGVTSLRRGFKKEELSRLLARAGVSGRVDQRPGFRLVATWIPASA